MKKYLALAVVLLTALFTANAFAFTPPPAPDHGWYVVDQTGQMSAPDISALNNKIKRISDATHNEFGVALIQSLDGDSIEDAAYNTFKKWGIGKHGLDNGVLIILSLKDHKSRIETGKGVGGEITDLQSKQILDGMRPQLRSGNFAGAFNYALDNLSSLLESRANQKATPIPPPVATSQPDVPAAATQAQSSSGSGSGLIVLFFVLSILGIGGVIFWRRIWVANRKEEERQRRRIQEDMDRREQQFYTPPPVHTVHHNVPVTRASVPLVAAVQTESQYEDNSTSTAAQEENDARAESRNRLRRAEEDEEERRERRAREDREEEDRRRRRDEESSSSGSSGSSGWGGGSSDSGSSGGGFDSGGGFGGGDSGGGGASGGW